MAGWFTFLLVAVATAVSVAESRAVPADPISLMLDSYGNPIMVVREKRTAGHPYPQRAMMFTGYYRPVRRSNGQATGVFAQGNAVSGEAFFGGMQAPHLHRGPEPIDEPEISSAEAQASPEEEPTVAEEEEPVQEHAHEEEHHHHHQHHQPEEPHHHEEDDQREHHHHEVHTPQEHHHEPEPVPFTTETPAFTSAEEPAVASTEVPVKTRPGKKTKKTPVVVDEEDDDDDDEEDDEPVVPFVPFKGTKRRQNYPHLNNFFPMVFSFPGVASRAGSSGSPPGAVTAIANSYSTGKGGVASSVATAYGGSPNGKKRRTTPSEE